MTSHCNCSDPSECSSTNDTIRELCGKCDHRDNRTVTCISVSSRDECPRPPRREHHRPIRYFDPGLSYFASIVTPLTNLVPGFSGCTGCVEFRMRRKNKTVTLQWEPFTGNLAASGIAFLTVSQSICNTPPYSISMPIYILYKGVGRITHIQINPAATSGNIQFYLNTDGSTSNTSVGDNISIPGGAITWIVD